MADASLIRRCGCRDADGKQLGARCPKLKSNPRHGTWAFRLTRVDPQTKRRTYIMRGGFASKAEAEAAQGRSGKALRQGTLRTHEQTVAEYLEAWIVRARRDLKPTTMQMYETYVRRDIIPALGGFKLTGLRKQHVSELIDALRDERPPTTIRRIHATLRSALNDALEDDRIESNPAARVKLPRVDKTRLHPWEPAEAGEFLDVAAGHRLGVLFETAILTGMRRGELIGLRWSDVDLAARVLTVRVQVVRVGREAMEGTIKTEAGQHRAVPLDDRLVGALVAWQLQQAAEHAQWGPAYRDSGRVFTMENGAELRPEYPSRLFEQLQATTSLRPQRFHDLRHLFASLALSKGEDMAVVSKLMGHSNSQITRDLYAHLVGDRGRLAVAGIASLLPARSRVLTKVRTDKQKAPLASS